VKWRALRLDTGNYSWGSEAVTRKTRILDVVYNASNNELARTQTLVKSAIVHVDAAPFKQWYLTMVWTSVGRRLLPRRMVQRYLSAQTYFISFFLLLQETIMSFHSISCRIQQLQFDL
jgi:ribosomal protein S8E